MSDHRNNISRSNLWLPAVLLAALALRILYLAQYHGSPVWEQLTVDNWYHHHWALSVADGNVLGDTTYFRAPLYVYCLGFLYSIFGSSLWVGRLFGLFVGLTSVTMTYVLGKRILDRSWALVATALHAALPIVIYFESELLLDPLFTLLLQVAVWRLLIWMKSERSIDIFWSGLAFGLASVCRPTALVVALMAMAWIALKRPSQRRFRGLGRAAGRATLFAVGLALCVSPILIRNLIVAGDPVLIASQGGINLYIGNNETADGLSAVLPEPLGHNWQIRQITHLAESAENRVMKPGEVSAYWQKQAINWILSNPGDFVALTVKKLSYLMANREIPNERSLDTHFASFPLLGRNPLTFGLILPLALLGIVVLWKREPGVRFLAAAMAVFIAGIALFFVNSRFRLPLMPMYCLLAAGGLSWIWTSVRKGSWLPVATIVPLVIVGWLSFDPPVSYPESLSVQNLTARGLVLYSKGEWRDASDIFRRAAELQPDFPEVNLNLGAAYLRLGLSDSARACFDREIRLHPRRFKAYQNLASICLLEKDYKQAAQLSEIAIGLASYDIFSHLVRMRALGNDPEVDNTRLARAVDEAAGATNDDLTVLNEGGALLLARGEAEVAISILQRAETAQPPAIETDDDAFGPGFAHGRTEFERRRGTSLHLRGYAYARLGRLFEATDFSRRAIAADSTLVEAYLNLWSVYTSEGRLREADSVFNTVTRRFPEHPLVRQANQGR